MNDIRSYTLVNELQNFYDADTDDPCAVLRAMADWIESDPLIEPSAINIHVGWDGEMQYVEGTVDHTRRNA